MTCTHLRQLFELCHEHEIKIGSLDVVRLVCKKCNIKETCPEVLTDEYDEIGDRNQRETGAPPEH